MHTESLPPIPAKTETASMTTDAPRLPTTGMRLILLVVGIELGQLLTALDQTVVGTAAPHILADLNGFAQYSWVVTSYLIASTITMPIYGKLSDLYGRRWFFLGGMLVFLIGSALAGTSTTMEQLILFRVVQGIGGGAIMPIVSSIIGDLFPPAERGKWQGVTVSVWGIASILGPLVGGWITDQWGWRWIFYINMPIGVVAFVITALTLQRHFARQPHTIDYLGVLTLGATTLPLLLALSWAGTQYAWTSPVILGLLLGATLMGGVFFFVEQHAKEPIIAPGLFANRIFVASVVTTFVVGAALFGSLYFLPLFIQGVLGQSATSAGATLTPIMIGVILSSVIGGFIMAKTGRYKGLALLGLAIAGGGMTLLARMDIHATEGEVARDMFVLGLGIGISMTLFTTIVQNAFPPTQIGQVTSAVSFFREIGGTMGLAILGAIMTGRFHTVFEHALPVAVKQAIPASQLAQIESPQLLLSPDVVTRVRQGLDASGPRGDSLFQQLLATLHLSLADAITRGFLIGTALIAVGFLATLGLREIPLRKSNRATADELVPPAT